jgi:uncharacterized membrane protein YhaH (DUF805 family)
VCDAWLKRAAVRSRLRTGGSCTHVLREVTMEQILEYLPFIIPVIVIQLALLVFALADLVRRERTRGPKVVWALIIVFVNIIGPILYFLLGREE